MKNLDLNLINKDKESLIEGKTLSFVKEKQKELFLTIIENNKFEKKQYGLLFDEIIALVEDSIESSREDAGLILEHTQTIAILKEVLDNGKIHSISSEAVSKFNDSINNISLYFKNKYNEDMIKNAIAIIFALKIAEFEIEQKMIETGKFENDNQKSEYGYHLTYSYVTEGKEALVKDYIMNKIAVTKELVAKQAESNAKKHEESRRTQVSNEIPDLVEHRLFTAEEVKLFDYDQLFMYSECYRNAANRGILVSHINFIRGYYPTNKGICEGFRELAKLKADNVSDLMRIKKLDFFIVTGVLKNFEELNDLADKNFLFQDISPERINMFINQDSSNQIKQINLLNIGTCVELVVIPEILNSHTTLKNILNRFDQYADKSYIFSEILFFNNVIEYPTAFRIIFEHIKGSLTIKLFNKLLDYEAIGNNQEIYTMLSKAYRNKCWTVIKNNLVLAAATSSLVYVASNELVYHYACYFGRVAIPIISMSTVPIVCLYAILHTGFHSITSLLPIEPITADTIAQGVSTAYTFIASYNLLKFIVNTPYVQTAINYVYNIPISSLVYNITYNCIELSDLLCSTIRIRDIQELFRGNNI